MLFCVSSIFLLNISAGRPQAAKDNVSIEQFHPEISRATNDEGRASIPKHESALERGKRISTKISSQELFEAYRDLRKEYSNFAFNPGAVKSWSVIKESKDGIQISLLKHKDDPSCPYVRMEGVVDGSIQDVWGFLELKNWPKYMPKMDPFYEGVSIEGAYEHNGVHMLLARKRTIPLLGGLFGKRDFTFISVSDKPRANGIWTSGTVSVVTDKLPRQVGYTRAYQDSVAFYEAVEPDGATGNPRTRLTIVTRIDLNDNSEEGEGGGVPMWLYVKTVGTSGTLALRNMRHEVRTLMEARLIEEAEKKAKHEDSEKHKICWMEKPIQIRLFEKRQAEVTPNTHQRDNGRSNFLEQWRIKRVNRIATEQAQVDRETLEAEIGKNQNTLRWKFWEKSRQSTRNEVDTMEMEEEEESVREKQDRDIFRNFFKNQRKK